MKLVIRNNSAVETPSDANDHMFKVSEANSRSDLTPEQASRIQRILKDKGYNLSLSKINVRDITNQVYNHILNEIKNVKHTRPFRTIRDIKVFVKKKLGIGKTESGGLTSLSGVSTDMDKLLDVLKIIAPYVWYYIVMSVIFRVIAWVTGNRNSLFGSD